MQLRPDEYLRQTQRATAPAPLHGRPRRAPARRHERAGPGHRLRRLMAVLRRRPWITSPERGHTQATPGGNGRRMREL